MKRIGGLTVEPPGLARFRIDLIAGQSWDDFRGTPKDELTEALSAVQHGLCAYCEIRLVTGDRQIEHFIPKRGPHGAPELALDFTNLLACCQGNTSVTFGPKALTPNPERVLPPNPDNLSCGQRKGDNSVTDYLDPRTIPAQPSLFAVGPNGAIRPDNQACVLAAISEVSVSRHIDRSGLNTVRLRRGRERSWNQLREAFHASETLPGPDRDNYLIQLAEQTLLPGADGRLSNFFTTARSFFAETAEVILARRPRAWI